MWWYRGLWPICSFVKVYFCVEVDTSVVWGYIPDCFSEVLGCCVDFCRCRKGFLVRGADHRCWSCICNHLWWILRFLTQYLFMLLCDGLILVLVFILFLVLRFICFGDSLMLDGASWWFLYGLYRFSFMYFSHINHISLYCLSLYFLCTSCIGS